MAVSVFLTVSRTALRTGCHSWKLAARVVDDFLAQSSEDGRFRRGSGCPVGRRQSRFALCPSVLLFVRVLVCIAVRYSL